MLIIVGGLPGTGKTTIAREVARQIGAVYLRIDSIEQAIRDSLLGDRPVEDAGYRAAYATALDNLRLGREVIADCVNPLAITRSAWRGVAAGAGIEVLEIEVVCSDRIEHRRRVETRPADIAGLRLPSWEEVVGREYEPWDREHVVVDTARSSAVQTAADVRRAIATRRGQPAAPPVRLLVLTGSMGAGKTTVMAEAADILAGRSVPHAAIDFDGVAIALLPGGTPPDALAFENLECLWRNCTRAGVTSLLLASAVETRSALERIREAIQPEQLSVCRVRAAIATMRDRVRAREPGMFQQQFVDRVSRLEEILDTALLEDFAVTNDGRSVTEVAQEVIVRAGWLA